MIKCIVSNEGDISKNLLLKLSNDFPFIEMNYSIDNGIKIDFRDGNNKGLIQAFSQSPSKYSQKDTHFNIESKLGKLKQGESQDLFISHSFCFLSNDKSSVVFEPQCSFILSSTTS